MTSSIIVIVLLLMLSAYFSASETAFTSVNKIRIKNLANDGDHKAKRANGLIERFDELLSTTLIGNNLVNIAMTAVATVLFINIYGEEAGATIATVAMTIIVLIFGEITPKSIAKERAEKFTMNTAPVIRVLMIILYPINWLFAQWKKLIVKVFKLGKGASFTEDELLTIVEVAETEGSIDEEQSELIQNAIEFNDLEAWDILTPRVEIESIEIDETKEEIAKLFLETGYTRIPVYEDDMDNIVGVLNQKDFHNYIQNTDCGISQYVKPVVFAPGTMKANVLLKKMQSKKTHMAIVVDEYGGTAGLVTMEDIIEELVGEIYDEYDEVEMKGITKLQDGSYKVMSNTNLEKFFDYFDVEEEMDATTVNGWVVLQLDKLPKVGDSFEQEIDGKLFQCHVTKADNRKSLEIKLQVKTVEEDK
ncbi:MAG: hemolysin family protein [Clostridia bacterium]|nr:hemolysin family protein [Clostridia bacterium]